MEQSAAAWHERIGTVAKLPHLGNREERAGCDLYMAWNIASLRLKEKVSSMPVRHRQA
jgi:hypothetical protein